jgi:uncharacterized tellurite resistance protein B-like protein
MRRQYTCSEIFWGTVIGIPWIIGLFLTSLKSSSWGMTYMALSGLAVFAYIGWMIYRAFRPAPRRMPRPAPPISPEEMMMRCAAALAKADGTVDRPELTLLHRVADGLGLSEEAKSRAYHSTATDLPVLPPETLGQLARTLVDVAIADGRVTPEEERMILRVAERIGTSPDEVREYIKSHLN